MEAINSATSVSSRTRFCAMSLMIIFQKYVL
jgi:hypothetical protein